jgi:hypothetical protein
MEEDAGVSLLLRSLAISVSTRTQGMGILDV